VTASLESVALIQTISRDIRNTGCCLISDRRLELIFGGALDLQLKLHRLRNFARTCDWKAEPLNQGRAAFFYPRGMPVPSPQHQPS
jgi:hypothetical protein